MVGGSAGVAGAIHRTAGAGRAAKRTRTKLMPYECGKDPVGSARERFSVKFYLIAMLFILFDIEVIFLVPWAVVFKRLSSPEYGLSNVVYFEMLVFITFLAAVLIYVI